MQENLYIFVKKISICRFFRTNNLLMVKMVIMINLL